MAINTTATPTINSQHNYRPLIVIAVIVLLFVVLPMSCMGIFWAGSSFFGGETVSTTNANYDHPDGFIVRSEADRNECQQRQMSIVTITSADGRVLGAQCRHTGGQR